MSQQAIVLKCRGLYTQPNDLGSLPDGSLIEADNIYIDRDDTAQPRRGFKIYGNSIGSSSDRVKQLAIYKSTLLLHYSNVLLHETSTGVFTPYSGDVTEPETGLKIKFQEMNSNLYFTTLNGVKKLDSLNGTIVKSGGTKALDLDLSITDQSGFFTQNSEVAYRIVWGYKDANNNLILGTPSQRAVISLTIQELLIADINNLRTKLDAAVAANGAAAGPNPLSDSGGSSYTNSITALTSNDTADTINIKLREFTNKLDNDMGYTFAGSLNSRYGRTGSIIANTAASPTVVNSTAHNLSTNDIVAIVGSNSTPSIDGTYTVTRIDADHFSIPVNVTVAGTSGSWTSGVAANYPTPTSQSTSITDYQNQQSFFNDIIGLLTTEPISKITAAAQTAGDFNDARTSQVVTLNFTVPANVTTNFFYQVYRSNISSGAEIDPGDELHLAFESNPTSLEITNKLVTLIDITPQSFLGDDLYTNANQQGILKANELPPYAKDIELYKNLLFYANTKTRQRLSLSLLSGINFTAGVSTITFRTNVHSISSISIANPTVITSTAHGLTSGNTINITGSDSTPSVDGNRVVTVLNANQFTVPVNVTVAGTTGYWSLAADTFTLTFNTTENASTGTVAISTADTPAQVVDETARSLVRVLNRYASNTFLYGYYISGPDDVPGNITFEARDLETTQFSITANSTNTGNSFNPIVPTTGIANASDNEVKLNRLYYSKFQQPEAVPLLQYFDVGRQESPIQRIVALRDSLFIFKTEGIYRISGETVDTLQLTLFDNTSHIIARETVAVGNNQIFVLTDDGIVRVSETGVSLISRPIENLLVGLNTPAYTNFTTASFGIFYHTQKKYYFWTVTNTSDVYATQCFVFNTITNAWTRLPISKTCAIINTQDDKMYLGATDVNNIEQERKDFLYTDYADREYTTIVSSQDGTTLVLNSITNVSVGDIIAQQVFLTPYKFNRVLAQLDTDPALQHDYVSTLEVTTKLELKDAVLALATKLDADPGTSGGYVAVVTGASTPSGIQSDFNNVVNRLNTDPTVVFNTYLTSTSTSTVENTVLSASSSSSSVTMELDIDLDLSTVTIYKAIATKVTWAPIHAGDATIFKHFRESNLLFSDITSNVIKLSYRSDIQQNYEPIPFSSTVIGGWGEISWGDDPWGGYSGPAAFRTYIPAGKQRCRFLNPKFEHTRAHENYLLVGLSITFVPMTERVGR